MSLSTFKDEFVRIFIWVCESDCSHRKAIFKYLREKFRREKKQKILAKYYEKYPEKKSVPKVVKISAENAARIDLIVKRQVKAAQDFADLMQEINEGKTVNKYLH